MLSFLSTSSSMGISQIELKSTSLSYVVDCRCSEYRKLRSQYYVDPDDGCLYQVTRVKTQADRTIVGYVRRVIEGRKKLREERQPLHIRDFECMVKESAVDAAVLHKTLTEVADRALIRSLSGLICGPLVEPRGWPITAAAQ